MSIVVNLECMCTCVLDLLDQYLYRCFPLPSNRWCCLNGDFILVSVTPSLSVNGGLFPQRYRNSSLLCNASSMIKDGRVRTSPMTITGWTVLRIVLVLVSSYRRGYNRDHQVPNVSFKSSLN